MRRFPITLFCLLLSVLALPTVADLPHPSNLRSDIIYTTKGEFVQVSSMRLLTLNAHVTQFFYDPLGLEIAYVGSETQGDQTVHFVKTVDVRTGHELSRLTMTAPQDDTDTNFHLIGWSVSGKYLLIQRFTPAPLATDMAISEYLRWDLSTTPPAVHPITPEAHLPPGVQSADGSGNGFASPDGHWIVFQMDLQRPATTAFLLYDPELDTFQQLTLPPKILMSGWSDNTHLDIWQEGNQKRFNVVTAEISPPTGTVDAKTSFSKHYPDLALDVEHHLLEDTQGSGGQLDSCIFWIRRTPSGKLPLGAAAAGLIALRREWKDADPQVVWSPTGKQIAFIANSELCVSDLTNSADLLPHEKIAVGVKLTCPEEQALALSDLNQIGLGIVQYAQDYDEHFPAATGFTKTIYPYIKSMEVFQVGDHKFVYEQPKDLSLTKMENPANTEMGYIDLPCARVVLFADGHVIALPKIGNGGQE